MREGFAHVTLEEIKQLIGLVQESSIAELEVSHGEERIRIVRQHQPQMVIAGPMTGAQASAPQPTTPSPVSGTPPVAAAPSVESGLHEIKAPMVGTFYRAPAPDAPPYVEAGSHVTEGQIICIIEAMKLMNEIPADRSGTVVEIAVENGQPVEYGQVLLRLKPD